MTVPEVTNTIDPSIYKHHGNYVEAYIEAVKTFPNGWAWQELHNHLKTRSPSQTDSYLKRMVKYGLVKKFGKIYVPLYYKCSEQCRVIDSLKKLLGDLEK